MFCALRTQMVSSEMEKKQNWFETLGKPNFMVITKASIQHVDFGNFEIASNSLPFMQLIRVNATIEI